MRALGVLAAICGAAVGMLGMRYLLEVSPWVAGALALLLFAGVSWLEAVGRERALNREFFRKLRSTGAREAARPGSGGTAEPGAKGRDVADR